VDVRILGPLEVRGPDGMVDLGLRKARLLFATLALRGGHPVASDTLAEALWPVGLPGAWESTLQAHVSRLRRALDPERKRRDASRIETRGNAYALRVDDDEVDARRFETLAASGRAALARGEAAEASALLTRALGEWRGAVLVDFADEPCIAVEARRLEESRLGAAVLRLDAELQLGHHATAVAELEVLVEANTLREDIWELLLVALYRSGRQADALRRYAQVRGILVQELGIEPGPALRDLEGAILRQDVQLDRAPSTLATAGASRTRELPAWLDVPRVTFVGRDSQLESVLLAWRTTLDTSPRALVLIEGEPGVGKTQLAREVARALHDEGAAVVGGRCVEEALHAFQPFAEVVDGIDAQDTSSPLDSDPARIVLSSIATHPDDAVAAMPIQDGEAMQYALFRALSALLTSTRLGAPPVLVLDDVHWGSPAALQVLAHVLRDDQRGRLLVVATARDTEVSPALDSLLAEMQRDHRLQRVPLGNLSSDDVARMIDAGDSNATSADVFRLTEGNPFYVEQMLRHVAESGGELDDETLPDSVRDTVARRLLRLRAETRRILGVAAVVGQEFSLSVLADVGGYSVEVADDLLDEARTARVVTERTGRVGSYAFTHGLIRNVLRDGLGAARVALRRRRGCPRCAGD
jgi:DNA-binding SARP family transcriptional activator/DNA polymerase III delta prime subunit